MKIVIILALFTLGVFTWDQRKDFSSEELGGAITSAAFLRDNSGFISGTTEGNVRLFSTTNPYDVLAEINTTSGTIRDIKVSPSG